MFKLEFENIKEAELFVIDARAHPIWGALFCGLNTKRKKLRKANSGMIKYTCIISINMVNYW